MHEITIKILKPGPGQEKTSLFYVGCPGCGTKVCKAGDGTLTQQICPKCSHMIGAKVNDPVLVVRYYDTHEEGLSDPMFAELHKRGIRSNRGIITEN